MYQHEGIERDAIIGPIAPAGFIATPVNDPPNKTSKSTAKRIPKPRTLGALELTAVPKIAKTGKTVISVSKSVP
jgi:hypothetical protein